MKYNTSNPIEVFKLRNRVEKDIKQGVLVEYTKPKIKRSIDQNSLLWLWLDFLADALKEYGNDKSKEFWYCYFLAKYPVLFEKTNVPKTTSLFNRDEMTWFLEQIQIHCGAEFGVELPDPEDKKAKDFFKHFGYEL